MPQLITNYPAKKSQFLTRDCTTASIDLTKPPPHSPLPLAHSAKQQTDFSNNTNVTVRSYFCLIFVEKQIQISLFKKKQTKKHHFELEFVCFQI